MVDDREYTAAVLRGAAETRAVSVKLRAGRLHVELQSGIAVIVPTRMIQGLQDVAPAQVRRVELTGGGTSLHWPDLDVDLTVGGLAQGIVGTHAWMAELGRLGGSSTSERKAAASRVNGAKGGRPRAGSDVKRVADSEAKRPRGPKA